MDGIAILALLFLLIGAGPLRLLEPSLVYLRLGCRIALAMAFGWITFIVLLLSLGQVGLPISRFSVMVCACVLVAMSSGVLWLVPRRSSNETNDHATPVIDLVATTCIGLFFGYIAWVNERMITMPWDHFTYWLVDAKQIFESGYLRTDTRVTNVLPYSSYQPLQAVLLYLWYGELIEQHTSLLTFLSAALASVFAYGSVRIHNARQKLVVGLIVLVVNYSVVEYLFSFYADISTAFMITLFFFLLVNVNQRASSRERSVRVACLLLVLVALYYVKTTNRFYIPVMLALWCWHDNWEVRWSTIRKANLSRGSVAFLALLGFTIVSRVIYTQYLLVGELEPHNVMEAKDFVWEFEARMTYGDKLADFVLSEYSLLCCSYLLVLGALAQKKRWTTIQRILTLAMIAFPGINLAHYFAGQYSLTSRSLLRYLTAGVYLLPMMVAHWNADEPDTKEGETSIQQKVLWGLGGTLVTATIFASTLVMYPYAFAPRHSGKYVDFKFLSDRAQIASRVEKRIKKASVLLATDDSDHYVTNMDLESIKYRYFLSKNTVGGLYRIGKASFHDLVLKVRPKYVFIQALNDELSKYFPRPLRSFPSYPALYRIKSFDPFVAVAVAY